FALAPELDALFVCNGLNLSAAPPGGLIAAPTDTWSLDVARGAWSLVADAGDPHPPGGGAQALVHDPDRNALLLFRDRPHAGTQTWRLDLDTPNARWTALPDHPSAREVHAAGAGAAYDARRRRVVLFATCGERLEPSRALWAYGPDDHAWTRLADAPEAAVGPGFDYAGRHDVFLALVGSATWIYEPATDRWRGHPATLERGREAAWQSVTWAPAPGVFVFQGGTWDDPRWALLRYEP
ncbi:MAG TPA: hypothetical protein VEL07_02095, partial [Planctomycetota bacterium]|nr:hypothetical protein [Planctomycetota bacterium]